MSKKKEGDGGTVFAGQGGVEAGTQPGPNPDTETSDVPADVPPEVQALIAALQRLTIGERAALEAACSVARFTVNVNEEAALDAVQALTDAHVLSAEAMARFVRAHADYGAETLYHEAQMKGWPVAMGQNWEQASPLRRLMLEVFISTLRAYDRLFPPAVEEKPAAKIDQVALYGKTLEAS